jgi:long-chain acyl-CoA synthetase
MIHPAGTLWSSAQRSPNKTAIFCGDARISYRDLDESTTALAKWFLDQGLEPGERVAVHWTNSIAAVQLLYGVFKAGLIAVTVNTRLKPEEIAFILKHSGARMCFSEPALSPLAEEAGAGCPVLTELPAVEKADSGESALPSVSADQPALIIYTSGTTARPKGVVHTHSSLYHAAVLLAAALGGGLNSSEEVVLSVLPLMHMAALSILLSSMHAGSSVALLPRFEPGAVLQAIETFQCTTLTCMPALWHFIVEEQMRNPRAVSSLRTANAAGDAVPVALQNRLETAFGIPLREGYGMTESVPLIANPNDAIRSGSLGLPVDGAEFRIVDFAGHDVSEGETGEILARCPANCVGYWNDPEATKTAIEDGWLHTGDLASRDADGYYWFRGRKKEIMIRAGSNISPQEVEEALYRHPAVREAGVVGQPDSVFGEIVVAFVVLREGMKADPDELRRFAQQHLADYKLPERFVFVNELPKSPTGKVHRRALKERLLASAATAT